MPSNLKRYQGDGHDHFITFSCYRQQPFLNDDHSRIVFEQALEKLGQNHQFYVFAYALMPEHVHMLLSEPKLHPLATTLSVLKTETSKRLRGNRPHFWKIRYYDFNILSWEKHWEKLNYIHLNPVRAGFVEKAEDWRWSSAHHYLTGEPGRVEIESEWTWNRRERELTPPMPTIKPSS